MLWKAAILSAEGSGSRGENEDTSVQVIRELIEEELRGEIVDYRIVPAEIDEMMAALIEMTDYYHADLIVTSGGIGLRESDVMPEATRRVIDREVPGLAEAMRANGGMPSEEDMLTRGIAGIRGNTLILNLPGNPKDVHRQFGTVMNALPMALHRLNRGNEAAPPS